MSVTLKSAVSTGQASVSSITITPGTHANGDVLVAVLESRGDHPFTASDSGWTLASTVTGAPSAYPDLKLYWRVASGSDPASFRFADSDSSTATRPSVAILAFGGVDTTSPFDTTATSGPFFNTATPAAPSVTPQVSGTMLFYTLGAYASNTVFTSITIPSGTNPQINQNTQMPLVIASLNNPTVNVATGTGVFGTTPNTGQGVSMTFTMRPAGVYPPPTVSTSMAAFGTINNSVSATATASQPFGSISSYSWAFTVQPAGSTATISGATTANASFTPDKAGNYTLTCTVTDNFGATNSASSSITVRDPSVITVGQVTTHSGNFTSSVVLAPPSHATGDLLVAVVSWWSQHTAFMPSDSGWTAALDADQGQAYGAAIQVYWRIAAGGDPASYTFTAGTDTGSRPVISIIDFAGVDPNYPIDVSGKTDRIFNQTSVAAPTVTTDIPGSVLLHILGLYSFPSGVQATAPVGSTELVNTTSQTTSLGLDIAYVSQALAGASATETFTTSDAAAPATPMVLALRPTGQFGPPTLSLSAPTYVTWRDSYSSTATASSPGATITTYAWIITSAPAGSTATLSGASTATASLTPDKPGSYTLQCTVTDSRSNSTHTTVTSTVRPIMWINVSGTAKAVKPWTNVNGTAH